ncbi:aminotransferase-like domain-containing protein [Acerihabitans arboris]|uniref:Aminotransferase class I/II-fold pyridoxal phosphate-dependent enzyme n=1 Tax=Acerihabitans arboris TaxID=2691583 RepID=A0A845SRW0_9GAMM|nr:PLP-dependent aminotransferase family protein [Acerihabitans arboris]NDL65674.1 aminotransferase class I/II-fold pyridoxal phosphate-dependent enzyme [Acerihabitans arboris]
MTRYQNLASILSQRIEQGLYPIGVRLPSIRVLSKEHGVSITTVQQAYRELEDQQLVEARAKSGYFVARRKMRPGLPDCCNTTQCSLTIPQWDRVLDMVNPVQPGETAFRFAAPDITASSLKPLTRSLSHLSQRQYLRTFDDEDIRGSFELREQIARLMIDSGSRMDAGNILITDGCREALSIAIRCVCAPGDVVAVEKPCFHAGLQLLHGLGMNMLEIPTDPVTGISVEALELALEQWPVKAILVTPTGNNPLGYNMPIERRKALLRLAQEHDVAIIEDDAYGELSYPYPRPATITSMDFTGNVLLCSSFSKTLAPGLRVGWIAPGSYMNRAIHMKYVSTGPTASLPQLAIVDFITQGHYLKHVRRMRSQYQHNRDLITRWVTDYFPCGTRISRPQGGFLLWVELDHRIDTQRLNRALSEQNISIAIGAVFSAAGKYDSCLRINFARQPTTELKNAVRQIGVAIHQLLEEK